MPHINISDRAWAGIERCHAFLCDKAPAAAWRAHERIFDAIEWLGEFPYHGRPYRPAILEEAEEGQDLRELIIRGGYLALYRYVEEEDTVYIIAFKHGREARYY